MSRVRGAISTIVTDHRSAFAVVAGIVGAVVGLAAVIFNWLIAVWMRATTGAADYSVTGGAPHGWPAWTHILIIAVPVVSALMYGPMIWRWAPTAKGHGIPEVMLAVRRRGGKIPGRVSEAGRLAVKARSFRSVRPWGPRSHRGCVFPPHASWCSPPAVLPAVLPPHSMLRWLVRSLRSK